jgi:hypothetical protein
MAISLVELVGCIWALMALLVAWTFANGASGGYWWRLLKAFVVAALVMIASYVLMRFVFLVWPYVGHAIDGIFRLRVHF